MDIEEIIEKQGWDMSSVMALLFRFIEDKGMNEELSDFLEKRAAEENEESESAELTE